RDLLGARWRVVAELVVGEAGELPIPDAAVGLARSLEALPDELLVVVLAGLEAEQRLEELGFDRLVPLELDIADSVATPFGDRDAQLDVARLLVLRIAEELLFRDADVRADVPALAVVRHDLVGVLVELRLLERAAPGDPGQEPELLVVLHLPLERAGAGVLVPGEDDLPDLHLGPFRHVEREVDDLRPSGHRLDLRRHLGVLEAFFLEHVADDVRDLLDQGGIDEGVEPDLGHRLLQPLVDLRRLDFLGADVVDDLDALTLLHVVRDQPALDAVREDVRLALDPQVVEKAGAPQTLKILADDLLGLLVVRRPDVLRRLAGLELDVVEVRLVVDQRSAALRFEAGGDVVDDRAGDVRRRHLGAV